MHVVSEQQRGIHCDLDLPPGATRGSGPYPAVIFAHGLESDGRNRRTMVISHRLAKRNIIGIRMDFTGHGRSDGTVKDATPQRMLADLRAVYDNMSDLDEIDHTRVGINGSGSGGMISLYLAAERPDVAALVIRGPVTGGELEAAHYVKAPTLLIHAERDKAMKALDRELSVTHERLVIPDSDRVFNDPISLELMVSASVDWMVDHLVSTVHLEPPVVETEPNAGRPTAAP